MRGIGVPHCTRAQFIHILNNVRFIGSMNINTKIIQLNALTWYTFQVKGLLNVDIYIHMRFCVFFGHVQIKHLGRSSTLFCVLITININYLSLIATILCFNCDVTKDIRLLIICALLDFQFQCIFTLRNEKAFFFINSAAILYFNW